MTSETKDSTRLVAPQDDFYLPADYALKFGDCNKAKKRGHVFTKVNGLAGYIVPSTKAGEPFKLERSLGSSVAITHTHDTGNSSEDDPEIAEDKFETLVAERKAQYESSAVGLVASIMEQCALPLPEATLEISTRSPVPIAKSFWLLVLALVLIQISNRTITDTSPLSLVLVLVLLLIITRRRRSRLHGRGPRRSASRSYWSLAPSPRNASWRR